MNDSYKKYIEGRLKAGNKVSSQYLYAITAVDCYGAKGDFYLLQFCHTECILLKCVTDAAAQRRRVAISSYRVFKHGLNKIYKEDAESREWAKKYDEAYYLPADGPCQYDDCYSELFPSLRDYNERLHAALKEIVLDRHAPVYVGFNKLYSTRAVLYMLQQKVPNVVLMQEPKVALDLKEFQRVLPLHDFRQMAVHSTPAMTVADCFTPQTLFVPLADDTLDAEFCHGKKWGDLLADRETADIFLANGVPCKYIAIEMQTDIFNNVFCLTKQNGQLHHAVLLHNALGVETWNKE